MIYQFFLELILCTSPLMTPIIKKDRHDSICRIPFSEKLNVQSCFLIIDNSRGRRFKPVDIHGSYRSYTDKEFIEFSLNDLCKKDDQYTYSVYVNVLPEGTKWESEPFKYDTKEKKFLVQGKKEDCDILEDTQKNESRDLTN